VPDVHYSIQYDILHGKQFSKINSEVTEELLENSYKLAKFVIPGEYGLHSNDKVAIGLEIISNLLNKIKDDLIWWNLPTVQNNAQKIIEDEQFFLEHGGLDKEKVSEEIKSTWRHVRTRLYFASAS